MRVVTVAFVGQITRESVEEKLGPISRLLKENKESVSVVFDLLQFTGYDTECRQQYIDWHRKHSDRLQRVAVVTDRLLLGAVVSAMGLAAGGNIRALKSVEDAEKWCRKDEERQAASR